MNRLTESDRVQLNVALVEWYQDVSIGTFRITDAIEAIIERHLEDA